MTCLATEASKEPLVPAKWTCSFALMRLEGTDVGKFRESTCRGFNFRQLYFRGRATFDEEYLTSTSCLEFKTEDSSSCLIIQCS